MVFIDTAGRLQIDEALMKELREIKAAVSPTEILLTVDAMIGQESVNVADTFNQQLDITGVILTKLDGDTRGGAALSIKYITGKPIKFVGMGEKLDTIEPVSSRTRKWTKSSWPVRSHHPLHDREGKTESRHHQRVPENPDCEKGSGTTVEDVNKLLKQFDRIERMMKQFSDAERSGRKNPSDT